MADLSKEIKKLDLKQNAIKILINSIYGAFGTPYFYFYNLDIAQSITLQGQDLIKFSIKAVNHYFMERWHLDHELHKQLGIDQYTIGKVNNEAAIYTDTDSVAGDTIINSGKFGNITIEKWYQLSSSNGSAGVTLAGHESVNVASDDTILNWDQTNGLHPAPVARIIRHQVTKERWKLTTLTGEEVIVTGDHSLIVFRDCQQLEVKARDVNADLDMVLVVTTSGPLLRGISSIIKLSDFDNEWVYDVEVAEDSHSFIANNILVHNSIYVQFDSAIDSIIGADFTKDEVLNICIGIDRYRLSNYFDSCFERYGKLFNTKNRLKFKLENLSESGIWLKKKNYVIRVAYEPNPNYELEPHDKRYLIIKGLESIKGSYPIWAREKLNELTSFIMDRGKSLDIEAEIIPKMLELKREALALHPNELAFNFNIRVYNKYIISEAKLDLRKGISIFPRAAATYNHMLIRTGLVEKYPKIREKDKIKFYYCDPQNNPDGFDVFAYSPGAYPDEIALPMDIDNQFFSLIVDPINRLLTAMGMSSLDPQLKRAIEVVKVKSRKAIDPTIIHPLSIVNKTTLEVVPIPEKFWPLIGRDVDIPEEIFQEYLSIITQFGLDTVIVPGPEVDKYLKRLTKKKEKADALEPQDELDQ